MADKDLLSGAGMKGRAIIKQILRDHGIDAEDFFGKSRLSYLMDARRDAVQRMRKEGYSWARIGTMIKRHHDTVRFYGDNAMHERKREHMRQLRSLRYMAPDVAALIVEFAKAERVRPAVLIAQWASERALYEASAKARAAA